MKKISNRNYYVIAASLFLLFTFFSFIACKPKVHITAPNKSCNYALQHLLAFQMREPTIRIDLLPETNPLSISADNSFYIIDKATQKFFHGKSLHKLVRIEVAGAGISGPSKLFTAQVASLSNKAEAEKLAKEIEDALKVRVSAQYSSATGTYQVRVGRCASRQEASMLASQLNQMGYGDLWIAAIKREVQGKNEIRLFYPSSGQVKHTANPLIIVPRRLSETLKVNQTPYRGIIEVFANSQGTLSVINELNIEEYLMGVVPCEMSPTIFSELEALKAQAIAARTYAISNMGQFAADGYDLCSTSRCQVYKGYSVEQELSNKAVQETEGLIAVYNDEPINALYTSTCGGHTEDAEYVFGGKDYPYLKGVECYPERLDTQDYESTSSIELIYAEDGGLVNEEIALLLVLGIIQSNYLDKEYLQERVTAEEIMDWTALALQILGKRQDEQHDINLEVPETGHVSFSWLINYLIQKLGWERRAQLIINNRDIEYLLAGQESEGDDFTSRRNIALLFQEGIITPFPYGSIYADLIPSRALALKTLLRLMNKCKPLPLANGVFVDSIEGSLEIKIRSEITSYRLSPSAFVFTNYGERVIPHRILRLIPGDRISFHHKENEIDFIKVRANLAGLADDRFSPYYRWEARRSRDDLGERIREYVPLGELLDLKTLEIGVSGRVVKLAVIGSNGQFPLTGLKIRQLLGLRENLFLIDREYNTNGTIDYFNFTGKGWGHGVGLCQVGSFGMALRGADFKEILQHYYSGIEFKNVY